MGAQLQVSNQAGELQFSEIATLERLELYLSHAPGMAPRKSKMEAFFHEISYSSFQAGHPLKTSLKPAKNGSTGTLTASFR